MKNFLAAFVLCLGLMTASVDADAARRFGGGGSYGRSAPTFSQKSAPTAPGVQQSARDSSRAQPASQQTRPQQATPQQRPSMMRSVLTGLAAALGISALLSMLGLGGAGIASFVMGAIIAVVAFFAIRFLFGAFMGRKPATVGATRPSEPDMPRERVHPTPADRSAESVHASVVSESAPRRGSVMDEFRSGSFGAVPQESVSEGTVDVTPADFDREAFLKVAEENYVKFQKAWGTGNVLGLSDFTTESLFIEVTHALRERGSENYDVVVSDLKAELLGIAQESQEYLAVVRFTGKLAINGEEESVDDVWTLTKPTEGNDGWLLAGVTGKA